MVETKAARPAQTIWPLGQNERTSSPLYLLINGVLFMSSGVYFLIDRAFDYSLDIIVLLLFFLCVGALLWAAWYVWRRYKRPKAQP